MRIFFTLSCIAFVALQASSQQADKTDRTLFVRFKGEHHITLANNHISVNDHDWFSDLSSFGEWRKTYSISETQMDSLRAVAERNLGKKLPNLNNDYRFVVNDVSQIDMVMKALNDWSPVVKSVKKAPKLFNCAAPDYFAQQLYLFDGTTGINAEAVWDVYNNHGEGLKICDLEYFFNENHTDLPSVTVIGPEPEDPFMDGGHHGTAVMGELASLNNGIGTTGIAYGSDIYFGGVFYNQNYELENALIETTMHLNPHDVVLIEQQTYGPNYDMNGSSQYGLVAVEWIEEYYDAIQLVIGQGIVVVEAAGNGEQNFDDPIYSEDNGGHYPFLEGNGSGAIIVGAGATGASDNERSTMWYSNYGSAVHVQGNGEAIYTTGYGDLFDDTFDEYYTADFGGTSGASPIVTGAVALLSSAYHDATGFYLTRDQIVDIFLQTGQPQTDGDMNAADAHIGPLPDVKAAVDYAIAHAGVQNNDQEMVAVYPNPGKGTFYLDLNNWADYTLNVTDLSGRNVPVNVKTVSGAKALLDLEQAPGIYFLNLSNGEKALTTKIVIE